ncbi:hypothetical protein BCR43DRAFT_496595 [Syncephalastrum racemosum]|uniref:RRM domain-containing protein n=1 Tax=Syncephalastrum racemosum TaxID=13706 RepID=A0A1X2H4K9_SYNRA|nr:hypothetical protein BCR43DRAFT_496595 [Syncephalastrum racemosum]
MSEVDNGASEQRYADERARTPPSRSRSRSPLREHSDSRYRSRSRSRDLPPREPVDQNPGDNLFVTGLSLRTNSADLEDLVSKYGKVVKAEVMYDPHTRESRGFGFIRMSNSEEAERVIAGVNGTDVDGRMITIEKARRSRPRTPTPGRYYGPPKRGPRPPRGGDPRYDRYYERSYMDRYDPPRYERGGYDRYDRGYDRYERGGYDRYDRGYDRYDRRPPPPRYDPYPPRPRSPY